MNDLNKYDTSWSISATDESLTWKKSIESLAMKHNLWMDSFFASFEDDQTFPEEDIAKNNRDIKSNFQVVTQTRGMILYICSLNKNGLNTTLNLSCKRGAPITNSTYNVKEDTCMVKGSDSLHLGDFPYNFKMILKDNPNFGFDIPVPERVIKRYLTEKQKKKLALFKEQNRKNSEFFFFQILKSFR